MVTPSDMDTTTDMKTPEPTPTRHGSADAATFGWSGSALLAA
jgi:hypothetical protein